MPRTILEIQAELTTVSAAIQDLIAGRRLTELRVGSGDFARLYRYQEITLDNLQAIRDELIQELAVLNQENGLQFRKMSNVLLKVTKFSR
jgi:hypothetical protein